MKSLTRLAIASIVALTAFIVTGTASAAVAPGITGGGCQSDIVQQNWQLRACITHHNSTIGYDGYVKVGNPLTACELRLLVIDYNTGSSPYYLNYPCNYGTYLPGGGFIGTKGHCYETEMVLSSAELYTWVYSAHDVCV